MIGIKDYDMPYNCYDCELHNYHECNLTSESIEDDYCWNGDSREKHCPLVEAIPKDQYEARLKADMVAMLKEIQIQAEENIENIYEKDEDNILMLSQHNAFADCFEQFNDLIQQRIDKLKEAD